MKNEEGRKTKTQDLKPKNRSPDSRRQSFLIEQSSILKGLPSAVCRLLSNNSHATQSCFG
jgi:hypothetical protein